MKLEEKYRAKSTFYFLTLNQENEYFTSNTGLISATYRRLNMETIYRLKRERKKNEN
jgi:hypothetical protein